MEITKEFSKSIEKIKKDEDIENKIKWQKNDINKYEKEIKDMNDTLEFKHKEEISLIKKIREINEDKNNHIDNLICNDLKQDKDTKFINLKKDLFTKLEENIKLEIEYKEKILERIEKIENCKKNIESLEETKIKRINLEIEKAKNGILLDLGNYIYDNEKNKKLINIFI